MRSKQNIYKGLILFFSSISLLFSLSQSRIISTWDIPSHYSLILDYPNNSETLIDSKVDYDISGSASFAYEHAILEKEKFNFYIGSELMLGKESDITLAFHSLYIMPTFNLSGKHNLLLKMGYSNLNTDDTSMPENAIMFALGSEIKISDDWSVNFSSSWYQTDNKVNLYSTCSLGFNSCYEQQQFQTTKLKYNRFSISLVYEISKKEAPKSSSRSKGRKR